MSHFHDFVRSPKGSAARAPKAALRHWLKCEQLEDRLTPSVSYNFTGAYSLSLATEANAIQLTANAHETAIAINHVNPGNVVVTTNNNGDTNSEVTAVTMDAGLTWTKILVGNSVDGLSAGGDRFDGTSAADRFGNIHVVYEHRNGSIIYAYSTDGGFNYQGQVLSSASNDKPWLAIGPDALDPTHDAVWVTYNHSDGANGQIFARAASISALGTVGAFSAEVQVSAPGQEVNYAIPAVGPNGQVTITYQGNNGVASAEPIFARTDANGLLGGISFGSQISVGSSNGGSFDYNLATPDRSYFAEPYVVYDRSSLHNGRVYMVYVDEPVDGSHNNVILERFSDDTGLTWSAPIPVSDTAVRTRMFSTVSIDQHTGFLYVSWYDARNDKADGSAGDSDSTGTANDEVQYFATVSTNGGASFLPNVKISAGTSDQARANPDGNDFGDYTGIDAFGGSAFSSWADDAGGNQFNTHVRRTFVTSTGGETLTLTGTPSDIFVIRRDASGVFEQIFENNPTLAGMPTFTATFSALNNIVVVGGATYTLDFSNGDPTPPGGISTSAGTSPPVSPPPVVIPPSSIQRLVAVATEGSVVAEVRALDPASNAVRWAVKPFDGFTGTVSIAVGDVNQDGYDDVIVGAGPGGGPRVVVLSGVDGSQIASFFAYAPTFKGGVNVASADFNRDGYADIVVGAALGSSHVKVFDGRNNATLFSFLAFGPQYMPGVRVAAGDVNNNGSPDILVASGAGTPPQYRIFEGANGALLRAGAAFTSDYMGGVSIAAGDVNGDGFADIILGAGSGNISHVQIFSGTTGAQLASFLVNESFSPEAVASIPYETGVSVAAKDLDGDGIAEILTTKGSGTNAILRSFKLAGKIGATTVSTGLFSVASRNVFEGFYGGITVGA